MYCSCKVAGVSCRKQQTLVDRRWGERTRLNLHSSDPAVAVGRKPTLLDSTYNGVFADTNTILFFITDSTVVFSGVLNIGVIDCGVK